MSTQYMLNMMGYGLTAELALRFMDRRLTR